MSGLRVGRETAIYAAAAMEYLTAEVLEASSEKAAKDKKVRITPRHIKLAVDDDEELGKLFGDIAGGGASPNIQSALRA